jgi:hypothetical protein
VGQRANLILVEGREYRLFYSHWCANRLPAIAGFLRHHLQARSAAEVSRARIGRSSRNRKRSWARSADSRARAVVRAIGPERQKRNCEPR